MTRRTAWVSSAALLLASPAAGEDPARALFQSYQARAARDVAEAAAEQPRTYATPSAPVPMEIHTGPARVAVAAPAAAPAEGASTESAFGCVLPREGSHRATVSQCLGCHGRTMGEHTGHPVEVDYEQSRAYGASPGHLRPLAEAVQRGAFVPDGKVRCVSCHDGRSRYRYRLAIPPGAEIRPAVRPSDPRTYDVSLAPRVAARAAGAQQMALPDGYEVSAKPLCISCHPMD